MTAAEPVSVVVPTTGRARLARVLDDICAPGCAPGAGVREVIVVDDRPVPDTPLPGVRPRDQAPPVRVLRTGGRGPAAARNAGWRAAAPGWVAFVDDDVEPGAGWPAALAADLTRATETVGAVQARIAVPLPTHRRPTDAERNTAGLATARWITADMAYRTAALAAVGGFDEGFPRAYREDADLALRVLAAGYRIIDGDRVTAHPARSGGPLASVRAQAGNADDARMRRKHGPGWRDATGAGRGMLRTHLLTTAAAALAVVAGAAGFRRTARTAAGVWAGSTAAFAVRRIRPGPRTPAEVATMLLTSVLIPPAAVGHRIAGELRAHRLPAAILFDRDDTLVHDVPYCDDPDRVEPVDGATAALDRVRAAGVATGVVTNQSGVARGLITPDALIAVNARVQDLLGPFGTWQICVHDETGGCGCRKPEPGMVQAAARALGVRARDCVLIGDTGADVDAARAAGARAVLVPTARTRPEEVRSAHRTARVAPDLGAAVDLALGLRG
ncbi:HAD-IIIA family hydrolase [Pseudonocardia parietis]|uniref:D,D-heptose 1,7-bisphosphate phosphatase n=1 Tax=Pseudonocardia parietis TaxID=570936 RepID=A0ABS4VRJ6_9PSEU|nr:HAD-IIIA family hydrolase [Pseudonocardia parietis]MBP2366535.1 histidinol-phosphate phosphatase family protein [Pseudonocardia parietis]